MADNFYDVAIIGGGPAGLFAAKHLLENADGKSILLLERGPKPQQRRCPADADGCKDCRTCTVLSGLGGSGLHSDGKLILDLDSGGYIQEFTNLSAGDRLQLVDSIKSTLVRFDGKSEPGPHLDDKRRRQVTERFRQEGFALKAYDVLHMGTTNLKRITTRLIGYLESDQPEFRSSLSVHAGTEITRIEPVEGGFRIRSRRASWLSRKLVVAVGKSGAPSMRPYLEAMGIQSVARPAWIGVRVETSAKSASDLLSISFDPKVSWTDDQGRVKTHCFCRDGGLLVMKYRGSTLVGGHSPTTRNNDACAPSTSRVSETVNFNVLASRNMEQRKIDDLLAMFKRAVGMTLAVQDMRSFLDPGAPLADVGRTSADEVRGEVADIRAILDQFSGIGTSIADFIRGLDKLCPGLASRSSRILAPALEWDFGSLEVSPDMETSVPGLYAVGDGAGLSQGIVHAAATGIVAARAICAGFATHDASGSDARLPVAVASETRAAEGEGVCRGGEDDDSPPGSLS